MSELAADTMVWVSAIGGNRKARVMYERYGFVRVVYQDTGKQASIERKKLTLVEQPRTATPQLYRAPSGERRQLRPVPKDVPVRSEVYLDFVRSHPCMHCGRFGPSEAAHYGGKGASGGQSTKASDLFTVSLCHDCHGHYTGSGVLPGGDAFTTRTDHYRWARDLVAEWVRTKAPATLGPKTAVGADVLGEYLDRALAVVAALPPADGQLVLEAAARTLGGRA